MLGDEVWLIEPIGSVAPATPEVVEAAPVASKPATASPRQEPSSQPEPPRDDAGDVAT